MYGKGVFNESTIYRKYHSISVLKPLTFKPLRIMQISRRDLGMSENEATNGFLGKKGNS
jgi:hypothetical protein